MLKKENFFITFTFIVLLIIPLFFDIYYLNNISYFMLWTFISLGLALIWGMGGILSFGQTAFFGLAGYSFAIISINFADTFAVGIWSPLLALAITAIFGAIVGYFLFYGGIYDVFIGIVTLAITLVLETFMAQTAGPEWSIGNIQMITFSLSSLFAGISGILYTNWGGYITPSSMGLIAAAMPVIWVAASGKNDFFSVFLGCILLVYISQTLAINGAQYAIIVMGLILVIVTRYFPDGIILMLKKLLTNKFSSKNRL